MRRYVFPILLLFAILVAGLYICLNTTWFLSFVFPSLVEKYFPSAEVQSYQVEQQSFKWPSTLILKNAEFEVKHGDQIYQLELSELVVSNTITFLKTGQEGDVSVKGLAIKGNNMQFEKLNLQVLLSFKENKVISIVGNSQVDAILVEGFQFENVTARIKGSQQQLQIYEVRAEGYGGTCKGQISLEFGLNYNYIFWLELFQLKPKALQAVNKEIFSNIDGDIDGSVRLLGNEQRITLLAVNLKMAQGGKISPSLIRKAMSSVVDVGQKESLQSLLENNTPLDVDRAVLDINTTETQPLTVTYSVKNIDQDVHLMNSMTLDSVQGLESILMR